MILRSVQGSAALSDYSFNRYLSLLFGARVYGLYGELDF